VRGFRSAVRERSTGLCVIGPSWFITTAPRAGGRRNWTFPGSDAGGDPAAIYTIVQSAKLNGVNPEAYLKNTLTKIAEGHPINKFAQLMRQEGR
jgi:hypothetical protein